MLALRGSLTSTNVPRLRTCRHHLVCTLGVLVEVQCACSMGHCDGVMVAAAVGLCRCCFLVLWYRFVLVNRGRQLKALMQRASTCCQKSPPTASSALSRTSVPRSNNKGIQN
ncbi:unnamed protein product, partial [Ectocarpus sp. 13 AM-2016]